MTRPDPYPFHRQEPRRSPPPAPQRPEPGNWDVLARLIVVASLIGIGVGLGLPLLRTLFNH